MARYGTVPPENLVFRALDTVGDGSGDVQAIGDYSDTGDGLTNFKITAQPGERLTIERMLIGYEDTAGMAARDYGNIGDGLTNGIKVIVTNPDDDIVLDLTNARPVKTNGEWSAHCYDATLNTWSSGNELFAVRWTFAKTGEPLFLDTGYSLVVRHNDDLSGLISNTYICHGVRK